MVDTTKITETITTVKTGYTNILSFMNANMKLIMGIIILVLFFALTFKQCQLDSKSKSLIIMNDSVKVLKNKAGELYASNNAYVITSDDLKKVNKELYDENAKLKRQKPLVVIQTIPKIEYRDTTLTTFISSYFDKDKNKVFNLTWNKDTVYSKSNSFKLKGSTFVKVDPILNVVAYGSKIDSLDISMKLFLSVIENAKTNKLEIIARTDFPGVKFNELEGYVIDPQKIKSIKEVIPKKRWGLGVYGGFGFSGNTSSMEIGPSVGVALTYDFLQW
jgi:hypothetical protein